MKVYKRTELKTIFDKSCQNVFVSKELKTKTLNSLKKRTTSLYWLRNCAAILIVSCLCLTLYVQQNTSFNKDSSNQAILQNTNTLAPSALPENLSKQRSIYNITPNNSNSPYQTESLQTTLPTYDLIKEEHATKTIYNFDTTQLQKKSSNIIHQVQIGDTEQELLNAYPQIEKHENGYSLSLNEQIVLYEVTNGLISNISILQE